MRHLPLACGIVLGLVAACVPASMHNSVRTAVQEVLAPGQRVLRVIATRVASVDWDGNGERIDDVDMEPPAYVEAFVTAVRKSETNRQPDSSPKPLVASELIAARVLGHEQRLLGAADLLVDVDPERSFTAGDFVVDDAWLIDRGAAARLRAGDAILVGSQLRGSVATVGPRTARVRPITDPEFRCGAVLWSSGQQRLLAEGVFVGGAEGDARLNFLPRSVSVVVGDIVCAAGFDPSRQGLPIIGTVEQVTPSADGAGWDVVVSTGTLRPRPTRVAILRQTVDAAESLAN